MWQRKVKPLFSSESTAIITLKEQLENIMSCLTAQASAILCLCCTVELPRFLCGSVCAVGKGSEAYLVARGHLHLNFVARLPIPSVKWKHLPAFLTVHPATFSASIHASHSFPMSVFLAQITNHLSLCIKVACC